MKKFTILILLVIQLLAIDNKTLIMIKTVGDTFKTVDGETFGRALMGMARIESRFNKDPIGDAYDYKYFIVVNKKRIIVHIDDIYEVKGIKFTLYKNKPKRVRFYYDVTKPKDFTKLKYGLYHMGIDEAKTAIANNDILYKRYKSIIDSDIKIMFKLLKDDVFSTLLASSLLVHHYNTAYRRKMWSPYRKAISRWNGGWYNTRYWKEVIKYRNIYTKQLKKGKNDARSNK